MKLLRKNKVTKEHSNRTKKSTLPAQWNMGRVKATTVRNSRTVASELIHYNQTRVNDWIITIDPSELADMHQGSQTPVVSETEVMDQADQIIL